MVTDVSAILVEMTIFLVSLESFWNTFYYLSIDKAPYKGRTLNFILLGTSCLYILYSIQATAYSISSSPVRNISISPYCSNKCIQTAVLIEASRQSGSAQGRYRISTGNIQPLIERTGALFQKQLTNFSISIVADIRINQRGLSVSFHLATNSLRVPRRISVLSVLS